MITANDAGYDMPTFKAGQQTIELRDADSREREFFLIALSPGKILQDLERFVDQGENLGTPPATSHGAMQTIPPVRATSHGERCVSGANAFVPWRNLPVRP